MMVINVEPLLTSATGSEETLFWGLWHCGNQLEAPKDQELVPEERNRWSRKCCENLLRVVTEKN